MIVGYARVSTQEQELHLQQDALEQIGVDKIYKEKVSGKSKDRPQLIKMMTDLKEGDKVVIYKLDRLGRSLKDLISIMEEFKARGIDLQILQGMPLDTSTPTGALMFNIMASFSEYEREVIRERTMSGLESARARGRVGGRKPKNTDKIEMALRMYDSKEYSVAEITEATGMSKPTLYKYIKARKEGQATT